MPSKPAKYSIEIWTACNAKSTCVEYTGLHKAPGATPENREDMRVVRDMTKGLKLRMLGTDKTNKPELPKELAVCTGRAKYSSSKSFSSQLDNLDKPLLTYTSKIKTARCLVVTSANIIDLYAYITKPAKYAIEIWTACNAKSTCVEYTGLHKAPGATPENSEDMRVVRDMTKGLKVYHIIYDNFFTS
ncbi:hypothetical protein T11_6043 [Trichinella zimbabwensis]|uniref:PiggyBac transposable element-derived protein domain-containing protein n=1 Tax=Trichinella zimbabwensis TaxID=268475 RepID=A0A0V1HPG2_9BILA|nr:hypothetical protein T11_6043 [Trichinella zimbabwensis]